VQITPDVSTLTLTTRQSEVISANYFHRNDDQRKKQARLVTCSLGAVFFYPCPSKILQPRSCRPVQLVGSLTLGRSVLQKYRTFLLSIHVQPIDQSTALRHVINRCGRGAALAPPIVQTGRKRSAIIKSSELQLAYSYYSCRQRARS